MEPFTYSNSPPLSIAQVDWTLYGEREPVPPGSKRTAADLLVLQETLLAAVITRVGEVEAAEWALDQAKTACDVHVAAALAAGVPAEKLVAAAGELASAPTELVEDREPAPAEG
ncbi:hypothetical protein [Arthrobacter sp. ES3-54]|uniref:hypothetical protein n=1 Tax=Arthrobacter sp. ES3-54 TaxID=1502991 RepID=UPI0024059A1A|nr:hypothetical protein [Arthrobacter sp. ES3-54]MDF9752503.1 hypothetical protein [Arthrobacter sp. ES3-54]